LDQHHESFFQFVDSFPYVLSDSILSLCDRMEYLNDTAFKENGESQEFWLTPSPGMTTRIPALEPLTQGLQVFPRSTAASSGAFPWIILARNGASPKEKVPDSPMPTGNGAGPEHIAPPPLSGAPTPTPGQHTAVLAPGGNSPAPRPSGHTPFRGF
jgi:hypothetical protein